MSKCPTCGKGVEEDLKEFNAEMTRRAVEQMAKKLPRELQYELGAHAADFNIDNFPANLKKRLKWYKPVAKELEGWDGEDVYTNPWASESQRSLDALLQSNWTRYFQPFLQFLGKNYPRSQWKSYVNFLKEHDAINEFFHKDILQVIQQGLDALAKPALSKRQQRKARAKAKGKGTPELPLEVQEKLPSEVVEQVHELAKPSAIPRAKNGKIRQSYYKEMAKRMADQVIRDNSVPPPKPFRDHQLSPYLFLILARKKKWWKTQPDFYPTNPHFQEHQHQSYDLVLQNVKARGKRTPWVKDALVAELIKAERV